MPSSYKLLYNLTLLNPNSTAAICRRLLVVTGSLHFSLSENRTVAISNNENIYAEYMTTSAFT